MELVGLERKEIKKHVAAIHVNGKLSLLGRKMCNVLLWNAYDNLLTQEKHRMRIRELAYLVGFDSNDLQVLKDALRGLAEIPLEWNVLHENGDEEWGVASMLFQAVIYGGYCSYSYSPDLREKFFNPEVYARINIGIQRNITTGHALTLYENCVRFRTVGSTGLIKLSDLRKLFGVDESKYYGTFKHFNNKILKPSVDVVNRMSDIIVAAELHRDNRRVSAVRFLIKENPQLTLWSKKPLPETQLLPAAEADRAEEPPSQHKTIERLLSFGLGQGSADRYLRAYSEEYINENLDVVEQDFQAGKIKDLPRYTAAALNSDYRPKKTRYEAEAERQKQRKQKESELRRVTQEKRAALTNEFETTRLDDALNAMSAEQRSAFETRFRKEFSKNSLFHKWEEHGPNHPVIRSLFRGFAYRELLEPPTEGMIEAYVRQRTGESKSTSA